MDKGLQRFLHRGVEFHIDPTDKETEERARGDALLVALRSRRSDSHFLRGRGCDRKLRQLDRWNVLRKKTQRRPQDQLKRVVLGAVEPGDGGKPV